MVRSGSLVVSDHHGLSRGSRPLDAEIPVGRWLVTRFFEGDGGLLGEGDLGVLLVHEESVAVPGACTWSRAVVQGYPAVAGEVIGDGDISLLLGTGPFASDYPTLFAAGEATADQVEEVRRVRQDPNNPRFLLPGASLEAFITTSAVRLPWFMPGGGSAVWLGRDAAGGVACVFVDWLADALGAQDLPRPEDVWRTLIPGAPGAELLVEVRSLEIEPANMQALFESVPYPGVRKIGEVEMRGSLRLTPGRRARLENPVETLDLIEPGVALPLNAEGTVAVFTRSTFLGDFITLLRFGNDIPTKWAYLEAPDSLSPVLVTDEVIERGRSEESVRRAFAEVSQSGRTQVIDRFPAVSWWPTGDRYAPSNWVVGLDPEGRVQALMVFDNRETASYTVRDGGLDAQLLTRLRSAQVEDPDFVEYMEDFEERLHEAGSVTAELRGELHWMVDRFL